MACSISQQACPLDDPALCCSFSAGTESFDQDDIYSRLQVLMAQERGHYRKTDYFLEHEYRRKHVRAPFADFLLRRNGHTNNIALSNDNSKAPTKSTNALCRTKMAEWNFSVVNYCQLRRSTVEVALSLLDQFLCLHNTNEVAAQCLQDRQTYQLAAMTALYTAIKTLETQVMDPQIVASLSRGICSEDDVVAMEVTMLQALDWHVTPPTAHDAVDHLVQLLHTSLSYVKPHVKRELIEKARYYVQLSLLKADFITIRPTLVAYGAIVNALQHIPSYYLTNQEREAFLSSMKSALDIASDTENVSEIQRRLADLADTRTTTHIIKSTTTSTPSGHTLPIESSNSNNANNMECEQTQDIKRRESAGEQSPRCVGEGSCNSLSYA